MIAMPLRGKWFNLNHPYAGPGAERQFRFDSSGFLAMNPQDLVADASGRVECCSVQGTPRRSGGGGGYQPSNARIGQVPNSILGRQHAVICFACSLEMLEVARLWGCASRNTRDTTGMVKEQGRGRRASLVKASRLVIFRSHCKTCGLGF